MPQFSCSVKNVTIQIFFPLLCMITSKPNECPAFHPYLVTYCSRYPCRMRKTRVQVCVSLAILVRVVAAFHWEIFVAQPLTPSWETPKYLTFFQYFIETCLHNVGVSCQREALTRVLTSFKSNFGDIVGGYFHSNFYQQVYYLKKKKKEFWKMLFGKYMLSRIYPFHWASISQFCQEMTLPIPVLASLE